MNALFTPFRVKNMELRNRIVMPPMCMYSAGSDGKATDWHSFHYRTRAQGGTGLIIQEATAVEARGRISDRDLGIWSDDQIPGLQSIVDGIKEEGAVPAIQLAHAGRKCTVSSEDVIAPSPVCFDSEDPLYLTPREMSAEDIDAVIASFKNAAVRAAQAGYEALEIHGAHGYLISEFLSPLTNFRQDEFGGSAGGRAEFLKRIIQAVRSVWAQENPLILRVSALDYGDNGNEAEDLAEMINLVKDEGLDLVHVSTGGVVPHVVIPAAPGFQIPAAKIIKTLTDLPVAGGGLITEAEHAEQILADEECDLVFLGRELLRNPYFPLSSAQKAGVKLKYKPKQYERS
ncbi:MAG: NADPH dehydrogenase NamA [Spirochaetales bacterium]|nr:NADPH dehydrogenase NamA [Spirochaetales bacterium]